MCSSIPSWPGCYAGLCILPLPDTDIRGTADVHAIEKEISEVECMLEALHWPKSGGWA